MLIVQELAFLADGGCLNPLSWEASAWGQMGVAERGRGRFRIWTRSL